MQIIKLVMKTYVLGGVDNKVHRLPREFSTYSGFIMLHLSSLGLRAVRNTSSLSFTNRIILPCLQIHITATPHLLPAGVSIAKIIPCKLRTLPTAKSALLVLRKPAIMR